MRTRIIIGAMMCFACTSVIAGGLTTNTNQNPIFFRQPAQNAVIGVQGTYYNPAGLALMDEGWHFAIGDQMAIQSREITSSYAPFSWNTDRPGQTTVKYEGKTFSPVIPTFDLSYNQNDWAASFHFGVVSGGGSCTFDEGLGSFESLLSLPCLVSPSILGYRADIEFTGKSFGFAGQFNYSYKVIDEGDLKLAVAGGLRLNYLKNIYTGGIYNYMFKVAAIGMQKASALGIASDNMEVDCTQSGFAINPILSAHFNLGDLDFAARYEFKTSVTLENDTKTNTANIAQFGDGIKSRSDIPALLAVGLNYSIMPTLRASAGYHLYFDKKANYNGREELLGANTWEEMFGLEWDACKKATISLGTQFTVCDFGDDNEYLNDMAFGLSSWCLGGGARYHINDNMALDFSLFKTFYQGETRKYGNYGSTGAMIPGSDEFMRQSFSFGLGFVYDL